MSKEQDDLDAATLKLDRQRVDTMQELDANRGPDTCPFDLDDTSLTWLWARGVIAHDLYHAGLQLLRRRREAQAAADIRARQPVDLAHVRCAGGMH